MSRPERNFSAASKAILPPEELASVLGRQCADEAWYRAVACYLAGGDGWREAGGALGGAFASGSAAAPKPGEDGRG